MKRTVISMFMCLFALLSWAQTHTLTLRVEPGRGMVSATVTGSGGAVGCTAEYDDDATHVLTYDLVEGKAYDIYVTVKNSVYLYGAFYGFSAWMRDGAVCSTASVLHLIMGKSDVSLTAVLKLTTSLPYSPGANSYDESTSTMVLDELLNGYLSNAYNHSFSINSPTVIHGDVKRIVAVGHLADDQSSFHELDISELEEIDLSQTSGMPTLQETFCKIRWGLKRLILNSDLKKIATTAFKVSSRTESKLKEISCYAIMPPQYDEEIFQGLPSGAVAYVPAEGLEDYKVANGWKNLTIQPLYETSAINVTMPGGPSHEQYKNMTLEVKNLKSEAVRKTYISKATEYRVSTLPRKATYQVTLKNAYGQVLGQTDDVELGDEDLSVAFDHLLLPRDVSMRVLSPDGEDVTAQARMVWKDDTGRELSQEPSLSGMAEGSGLTCHIALTEELARRYAMPAEVKCVVAAEGENALACQLQPLKEVTLSGVVKDKTSGQPLPGAYVALSQQLGGRYAQAQTATTDDEGGFQITGTNEPALLSVAVTGYLNQSVSLDAFAEDAALPTVEMERITGPVVTTWLTYTATVADGEEATEVEGYNDLGTVAYKVYNETKGAEVQDVVAQSGMLLLPEDVEQGDSVVVTATSLSNDFRPVTAGCVISAANIGYVTLPLVQLGGLDATVTSAQSKTAMGLLYDSEGQLVRSGNYSSAHLKMTGVADGDYTLVTMTLNTMLRRVLLKSTLDEMGLSAGTDYVENNVHVESGRVASVTVTDVPNLDAKSLQFTDPANTYIVSDKATLPLGDFFTLKARFDFSKKYAGRIGDVKFVLDLPDEISVKENSALTGRSACDYSIDGMHYIFPVTDSGNGAIRLCLTPNKAGRYRASGYVSFTLDGSPMIQAVGSVWVQANGLTMDAPRLFSGHAVLHGTAPKALAGNVVEVYDYGKLTGRTMVRTDGKWDTQILLPDLEHTNIHALKAKISTSEFGDVETATRFVVNNASAVTNERIEMFNMNAEFGPQHITFDPEKWEVSPAFYYFMPGKVGPLFQGYSPEFTFMAFAENNDTTQVRGMEFIVLSSDGTKRHLKGKYDGAQQCWYAKSDFPSSWKIPVSVYTTYDYEVDPEVRLEARLEAQAKALDFITGQTRRMVEEKSTTELLVDGDDRLEAKVMIDGQPFKFDVSEMDYDEGVKYALDNGPMLLSGDEGTQVFSVENEGDSLVTVLVDVDEKMAMQMVMTEMEDGYEAPLRRNGGPRRIRMSGSTRWAAWGFGASAGSKFLDVLGLKCYFNAGEDMADMEMEMSRLRREAQRNRNRLQNQLDGSCGSSLFDGDKFSKEQKDRFSDRIDQLIDQTNDLLDRLQDYLDSYKTDMLRKGVWDITTTYLGAAEFGIAAKAAGKFGGKAGKAVEKAMNTDAGKSIGKQLGLAYDGAKYEGEIPDLDARLNELIGLDFWRHKEDFENQLEGLRAELERGWKDLEDDMNNEQQDCDEEDDDDDDDNDDDNNDDEDDDEDDDGGDDGFPTSYPRLSPILDPSGYVYEAVPSNRLEGVTATAYQKDVLVGDNGGWAGEREVKWDAEAYGQENPLKTDARGMYRWDVPQGLWQVRLQKEGYEPTQSAWLPVPPPQLDVNLAMVQNSLPEVQTAHAYEEAVAVKFNKYMVPALLSAENITVTEHGTEMGGSIVLEDEEEAAAGVKYASRLRFVPETAFTANEVTLRIRADVKSYAGQTMAEDYEVVLPVEREVKQLLVDTATTVGYGSFRVLRVKALPASAAAGRTVRVGTTSGIIASLRESSVVLNENGEANVTVQGDLPGTDLVTYVLEDTELKERTLVKVVETKVYPVAVPEASIASETEVARGTEVVLTCETAGAVIYYTLDGTCPCTSDSRILYDGTPIVITEETTLRVMAVLEGKGESEVATYHYTVPVDDGIITPSSQVRVAPVRVVDSFRVEGLKGQFDVAVYDMSGELILMRQHLDSGQSVSVVSLPRGLYLVSVTAAGKVFTQRIVKAVDN